MSGLQIADPEEDWEKGGDVKHVCLVVTKTQGLNRFEALWSLNFIDLVSMIKVSTLSQRAPQEDSNELIIWIYIENA